MDNFKQKNANNYSLCNVVTNLVEYDENVRPDTAMLLGRKQMTVVEQQVVENFEPANEPVEEVVQNLPPPVVYKKVQEQPKSHVIQGDNFFNNPPVTYVQNVAPIEPARKSQVIEVKQGAPEISKTGEKVTIGEPKILRTYVDESSRRSYRGEDRSTLIVPKSPRNGDEEHDPEMKQAMVVKPENYMNMVPMEELGTNGKLVKRTVIIKDEHGQEIDRYEESLDKKNEI